MTEIQLLEKLKPYGFNEMERIEADYFRFRHDDKKTVIVYHNCPREGSYYSLKYYFKENRNTGIFAFNSQTFSPEIIDEPKVFNQMLEQIKNGPAAYRND